MCKCGESVYEMPANGPCKYQKDGERQRKTSKDAERRQKK